MKQWHYREMINTSLENIYIVLYVLYRTIRTYSIECRRKRNREDTVKFVKQQLFLLFAELKNNNLYSAKYI